MEKSSKMANINTNVKGTILWYLILTQPLHKIKKQGIEVLASIIYLYYTTDTNMDEMERWAWVFDYNQRIRIREGLGNMGEATFNNHLSSLRKIGAISKSNRVKPGFILPLDKNTKSFDMILRFNITD